MKEGWTYKKLGEVAFFARGLTYSKNDEVERSNNIVLRSNNIDLVAGKLDFSELKYLKSDFVIPEDKRLRKGSLFICMSNGSKAHLGKVAYVDKDYGYAFGGFMGQITPNNDVDGLFLHYALTSPLYKEYIKSLSEGANINNLKFKDLAEFVIKYPSLSEQQSIVKYLDSAFAKIDAMKANAEKSLNEAQALFQASLKEMLEPKEGWEECLLIEEFSLKSGDYLSSKMQKVGDVPVYGGNGITGYHDSYNYDGNQLLIGRVGALCGNIHLTNGKIWVTDNAFVVKNIKDYWNIIFLKYELAFLNLNQYASQSAQPVISNKSMKDVIVQKPSFIEQQKITTALDSIKSKVDRLEENYKKISQECDALKQAILRQVFE